MAKEVRDKGAETDNDNDGPDASCCFRRSTSFGTFSECQRSLNSNDQPSTLSANKATTIVRLTFLNRHSSTLVVRLDLVPKDHSQLPIFNRPYDEHLAFLLQLLYGLWSLLPRFLQRTDLNASALPCLTLNLCQQGGFVTEIEFMLDIDKVLILSAHNDRESNHLVGIEIGFLVPVDTVVVSELF